MKTTRARTVQPGHNRPLLVTSIRYLAAGEQATHCGRSAQAISHPASTSKLRREPGYVVLTFVPRLYSNRRGNASEGNQSPPCRAGRLPLRGALPCLSLSPGRHPGRRRPGIRLAAPVHRRLLSPQRAQARHDSHRLDRFLRHQAGAHGGRDPGGSARRARPRPRHDPRPAPRLQARIHRGRRRHERQPGLHR